MTITRRRLLNVLGISGMVLSSSGCLGLDGAPSSETPGHTETPTETWTVTAEWGTEIPETRPSVSCSDVSRPEADSVDRADALAPREYPGRPPSEPGAEAAEEYATTFELAYRQNDEMENIDEENNRYLTQFDFVVQNSWVAAGSSDSTVVRLQYAGSGTVHNGGVFDYITQYVMYYIDPKLVVRARTAQPNF